MQKTVKIGFRNVLYLEENIKKNMENSSFKIIALSENTISNQDILIAILSPITLNDIDENQAIYSFNPLKEYVFVLPLNSSLSQEMIDFSNEMISFNVKNFKIQRINFEEIDNEFGYLHFEIVTNSEKEKDVKVLVEEELENYVSKKVLIHRTDAFFHNIFIKVFNENYNLNFDEILSVYRNVCDVCIFEICMVITESYNDISDNKRNEIILKYRILISNGKHYYDFIKKSLNYFGTKKNHNFESIQLGSFQIFQLIMGEGYRIAFKRFEINIKLNNQHYFDFALISDKNVILKIFLTPYGIMKKKELGKMAFTLKLSLESFLKNHNIYVETNDKYIKQFETHFIFRHNDLIGLFVPNENAHFFNYMNFNPMDNPLFIFLDNGQINLMLKS